MLLVHKLLQTSTFQLLKGMSQKRALFDTHKITEKQSQKIYFFKTNRVSENYSFWTLENFFCLHSELMFCWALYEFGLIPK